MKIGGQLMLTPIQREDLEIMSERISELHDQAQILKNRWDNSARRWQHSPLQKGLSKRLNTLSEHLSDLVTLADKLDCQLHDLRHEFYRERPRDDNPFSEEEIAGLVRLNRRLADLESHVQTQVQNLKPDLQRRLDNPDDRMADYEIEVTLRYTLREDDAEFDPKQDNFLTVREFWFDIDPDEIDHCDSPENILGERHCWLFHDLYDHSYGLKAPRVPLRDCLRIGDIWVDIEIYQQYWLNVDRGEWLRFNNFDDPDMSSREITE